MTGFFSFMQCVPGSAGMQSFGTASGGYDVAPSSLGDSSRRMVGFAGGVADVVQSTGSVELAVAPDRNLVSAVGRNFQSTPLILSTRGHLDSIKRLMKGDPGIGCGCR